MQQQLKTEIEAQLKRPIFNIPLALITLYSIAQHLGYAIVTITNSQEEDELFFGGIATNGSGTEHLNYGFEKGKFIINPWVPYRMPEDDEEWDEYAEHVTETKRCLLEMLKMAPDAIVFYDDDGSVDYNNDRGADLTGPLDQMLSDIKYDREHA